MIYKMLLKIGEILNTVKAEDWFSSTPPKLKLRDKVSARIIWFVRVKRGYWE